MAGAALCEPPCADFVAGTAAGELEAEPGDFVVQTFVAEYVASWTIFVVQLPVRGVSVELEAEHSRLFRTTPMCRFRGRYNFSAASVERKLRTVASWQTMRTGDSYTTHHTLLLIHHSSYTTDHTPLIIHHSSYTAHVNLHAQISWQVQHFVNLHVQILWQPQHFVNLHAQISGRRSTL